MNGPMIELSGLYCPDEGYIVHEHLMWKRSSTLAAAIDEQRSQGHENVIIDISTLCRDIHLCAQLRRSQVCERLSGRYQEAFVSVS
jgi:hypothetical protein